MTPTDCKTKESLIDSLISNHEISEAQRLLQDLPIDAIPDSYKRSFAVLCRRSGLNERSLKLLHPLMVDLRSTEPSDLLEYSSTLRKLGMVNQSLRLLNRCPESAEKKLYQAFCKIHLWDWEGASVLIEDYLGKFELSKKQNILARVNLALCFLGEDRLAEAEIEIEKLLKETHQDLFHLHLNCLEMKGQTLIRKSLFSEADQLLQHASELCKNQPSSSKVWIEKWKALAITLQGDDSNLKPFLQSLRKTGQWEALRDLERNLAVLGKNLSLAHNVYYGTPYPAFKRQVVSRLPAFEFPRAIYRRDLRYQEDPIIKGFDLPIGADPELAFGKLTHRTALLLLSDSYRPWTVHRIFDELYPDEIYDPFSSLQKIYQNLNRLKETIVEGSLPLEMKSTQAGFRLRIMGAPKVMILDQMIFSSTNELFLHLLEIAFGNQAFESSQIEELLHLSSHQTYRLLADCTKEGLLNKQGPRGMYRLGLQGR